MEGGEREHEDENEQQQRQEEETRPWSDIPFEVSNLILGNVSLADEAHFSCVCKNWCSLVEARYSRLPMELEYNWYEEEDGVRSTCKINRSWPDLTYAAVKIENFSKWSYTLEDEIYKKEERGDFIGSVVVASRKGWLLLQNLEKGLFLLFNPFIKEIIRLPSVEVETTIKGSSHRATISADPTSPDCVVFLVECTQDKIKVSTWRPSCADSWNRYIFDGSLTNCEDVVYSQRKFYCLFDGGILGAFNLKSRTWVVLTQMAPVLKPSYDYHRKHRLVKFQGKLLLVCSGWNSSDIRPYGYWNRLHSVFRFDWHNRAWVKQGKSRNLKIGLFLDPMSFAVGADETTKRIGGKVYWHAGIGNLIMDYCFRCHKEIDKFAKCSECTSSTLFSRAVFCKPSRTKPVGTAIPIDPALLMQFYRNRANLLRIPRTAASIQDKCLTQEQAPSLAPNSTDSIQDNPTYEHPFLTPDTKKRLRKIWIEGPC